MSAREITSNVLNVTGRPQVENEITGIQYISIYPYASTNYNNANEEIRFVMENQNDYWLPAESLLEISFTIPADENHGKAQLSPFNGVYHAFSYMQYRIDGVKIDEVRNPGVVSAMKNICSLTPWDLFGLHTAGLGDYA